MPTTAMIETCEVFGMKLVLREGAAEAFHAVVREGAVDTLGQERNGEGSDAVNTSDQEQNGEGSEQAWLQGDYEEGMVFGEES